MTELTRQRLLEELARERSALMALLPLFSDQDWHTLARDDGWRIHDVAAHIADVHLDTAALSGVENRPSEALLGVTLPMLPNGRIDQERLNMLRYEANRQLSRSEVMARLHDSFEWVVKTLQALTDDDLAGPGPYGPPETLLEWFNATVRHNREHRNELEHLQGTRT